MNKVKYLVIHHAGGTTSNPLEDTSNQTFEIINAYHKSLGWGGCGYHYVIEKNGKVTQGRKENEEGAHTIGHNKESIGICVIGNFDVTLPTEAQISSLKTLLGVLKMRYDVPIVPHRHFANKSCYGRNLSDSWASDLIKKIEPPTPCVVDKAIVEKVKMLDNIIAFIKNLIT